MSVESGFDELQATVNVEAADLSKARLRRNMFLTALPKAPDVVGGFASGSLARGTHRDPINDVDVVILFNADSHPDWGVPGPSADAALDHAHDLVHLYLGPTGSVAQEVRQVNRRNHSVKCFLDDPADPYGFTVDVAPALVRADGGIWLPESATATWIASDPQYLIDVVAKRHSEWNQFARLVRVLKRWNADHGNHMKSLTIEVLALHHLPVLDRPLALQRFFAAAATAVWSPIVDPSGLCGEIQPDLDRGAANDVLVSAADLAWRAVDAQANGDDAGAMCLWRQLFGGIYPEPAGGCQSGSIGMPAVVISRPKRPVVDAPQG